MAARKKPVVSNDEATESRTNARPSYGLEPVDELPEQPPRGSAARYFHLLTPCMTQPDQNFLAATFTTAGGAARAARSIKNGSTKIPGDLGQWEITAWRGGDDESRLYVKYTGDAIAEEDLPTPT